MKSQMYYSNLGLTLDCVAQGSPTPELKWYRVDVNDNHRSILIQSSDLMYEFDRIID